MLNVAFDARSTRCIGFCETSADRQDGLSFRNEVVRDRRVPAKAKIQALLLSLLRCFSECIGNPCGGDSSPCPADAGIPIDIAWNGLENIVGPILFMGWMLPPSLQTDCKQILREEAGPVIDVQHYSPKP
jgi:hypothetical protein